MDGMFWKGLLALSVIGYGILCGPPEIQFGLIWWFVYLIVFSNFITAMQFVVDRYAFISSLGYSLIVAYVLRDYPVVFGVLLGLHAMRTMTHLPTYDNLTKFYQSNAFNFPDSEVALGNLGVNYMHCGKAGSAVDVWQDAIKINPHYDVPHYNLYSIFKSNGMVQQSYEHLKNCLDSKIVHFPTEWNNEKIQLEQHMKSMKPLNHHMGELNERYRHIQPGQ